MNPELRLPNTALSLICFHKLHCLCPLAGSTSAVLVFRRSVGTRHLHMTVGNAPQPPHTPHGSSAQILTHGGWQTGARCCLELARGCYCILFLITLSVRLAHSCSLVSWVACARCERLLS